MRRLGVVLVVLLMAVPAALTAAPNIPAGFSVESQRPLHSGVEYLTFSRGGDSPALAHVAHMSPGALVDLRMVSAHDRITHATEDRELPSSMCARVNCMVAINGDFWDYQVTKQSLGGVVSGGRMLRSPHDGHPQVTLTGDGRLSAGKLQWSGQVSAVDGTSVALTGINRSATGESLGNNQLVLFTSDWGATAPGSPGIELVIEANEPLGSLNRSVTVEAAAQGLRPPGGPIPPTGGVLRGSGTGEEALRRLWASVATGNSQNRRPLTLSVTSPVGAVESVGAHPVLLRNSQKVFDPASDSFTADRHPRTVLGWNGAGEVFFVTVDDRLSESRGMTLAEAADLLLGLGATDAVNLDGGGGTTFVVDGQVMNQPEEGKERPSVNALVAVRRAATPVDQVPSPPPPVCPGSCSATPVPQPVPAPPRSGYWMVGSDGAVYAFGDARHLGNAAVSGGAQAVDLEPTPSSNGYWIVDDNGSVFAFGDARYHGNADRSRLTAGEKVTSLSATPSGNGYWVFTSRGRVLALGDAVHFGDVSAVKLNGPVLDSIPTASGRGYYMVASDGGIFTFGDAVFHGSTGDIKLNAPVQSLVPDPDGVGYWLVASDGGVFSFQGAFRGSLGAQKLNKPVTGMVPFGNGYLMVGEDGGIFNFSDKAFAGSLGATPPARPVVSVAALR
ncbi:MAG: phosphodiester glycosidase family protein [Actinomycetota bacterium]|nr:phosphodiester glycosidase family protein [Actinomycetota bacterium]